MSEINTAKQLLVTTEWAADHLQDEDVRLLDGGRKKWEDESRKLTTDVPEYEKTKYSINNINKEVRAFRDDVAQNLGKSDFGLVDVRSSHEFTGK